ncbi:MAG TPA: hypothetical protein VMH81_08735 [Bryobacteraceae bacterium]|nr:hypothetical protein [Bryobacteraceae bacterium]
MVPIRTLAIRKSLPFLVLFGMMSSASLFAGGNNPERTLILPAGTRIPIRLAQSIDTRRDRPGTPFLAHVSTTVWHNGQVILPRGTICRGHVAESRPSGRLKGRAVLSLRLDSVEWDGRKYTIDTSSPSFASQSHKKRNLTLIGGGAGTGATIGAIAGGGVGAAVGAGAGAVVGVTGAAITGKRQLHLAPETRVVFTLRESVHLRG